MSEIDFTTGQWVQVIKGYNHIITGTMGMIVALDKITGEYKAILKNGNGIVGAIPVNYLQAIKK